MDVEERKHLEELRRTKVKRLRVLELQQAQQGSATQPGILTEIADLKRELEELELQLSLSSGFYPSPQTFAIVKYRKLIEVELKGSYSPEIFTATIRAIAAIVNMPVSQVRVIQVLGVGETYRVELPIEADSMSNDIAKLIKSLGGNIIYKVDLPKDSADQFFYLYHQKDDNVVDMGVQSVKYASNSKPEEVPALTTSKQSNSSKYFTWIAVLIVILLILDILYRILSSAG